MKYRIYTIDDNLHAQTIATRSSSLPISAVARLLRDLAWKHLGPESYIVHDDSLVGGYYRNNHGQTIAVELEFTR